jgi:hypothetical protein
MHVGPMPGPRIDATISMPPPCDSPRIDATMRLGKAHAMDWHGQTLEASGAYRVCLPGPASQQACGLVASRLEARDTESTGGPSPAGGGVGGRARGMQARAVGATPHGGVEIDQQAFDQS